MSALDLKYLAQSPCLQRRAHMYQASKIARQTEMILAHENCIGVHQQDISLAMY